MATTLPANRESFIGWRLWLSREKSGTRCPTVKGFVSLDRDKKGLWQPRHKLSQAFANDTILFQVKVLRENWIAIGHDGI